MFRKSIDNKECCSLSLLLNWPKGKQSYLYSNTTEFNSPSEAQSCRRFNMQVVLPWRMSAVWTVLMVVWNLDISLVLVMKWAFLSSCQSIFTVPGNDVERRKKIKICWGAKISSNLIKTISSCLHFDRNAKKLCGYADIYAIFDFPRSTYIRQIV